MVRSLFLKAFFLIGASLIFLEGRFSHAKALDKSVPSLFSYNTALSDFLKIHQKKTIEILCEDICSTFPSVQQRHSQSKSQLFHLSDAAVSRILSFLYTEAQRGKINFLRGEHDSFAAVRKCIAVHLLKYYVSQKQKVALKYKKSLCAEER